MQIKQLAYTNGTAGSNGAWRSHHSYDPDTNRGHHEVWHYSTLMLRWQTGGKDGALITESVYASTGHGSVSDQGAMNQLFRALGLPLYFSRKGGADIQYVRALDPER